MMGQQEIEERRGHLRAKLQELGESLKDYRDLGGYVRLRFYTGDPADFMEDLGTEEVTVDLIGIEVDD